MGYGQQSKKEEEEEKHTVCYYEPLNDMVTYAYVNDRPNQLLLVFCSMKCNQLTSDKTTLIISNLFVSFRFAFELFDIE